MHADKHPLAGEKVTVDLTKAPHFQLPGVSHLDFTVEDWWDRLTGESWMGANGNPAAMIYGMRSGFGSLPLDDEVVYGHDTRGMGHLVHASEIMSHDGDD